ncbi:MAG: hypothetical protein CMJ79_12540 [Planctomycetaceae bacterium]|nr:hypothetical protein [Planctomycetaceae bacterium]|tara:strand:- start:8149 stop:9297 length:1149 start_codon:yes stop_codon:yes gene_type:complete
MADKALKEPKSRVIWNPFVDFLGLGGLSVIVVILALVFLPASHQWWQQFSRSFAIENNLQGPRGGNFDSLTLFWLLTIIINHPHFMASYRLLYRSREQIQTYKWSSVRVPILLGLLSIVVMLSSVGEATDAGGVSVGGILYLVMSVGLILYLGWHYNLQAWGIMSTYLYLGQVRLDSKEKWLIKSGAIVLVVIHGLLYLASSPLMKNQAFRDFCVSVTPFIPMLAFPFFILGGLGFYNASKRTGRRIPLNAIVPWVAIYVWYYAIMNYHDVVGVVVFVQLAHALQYLVVTTRVESNVAERKIANSGIRKSIFVYTALLAVGYVVLELPGVVGMQLEYAVSYQSAVEMLVVSINLHHFFVDGAIWKISNPAVRKDLFAHLETS